jgi:RNA polymerase sigma-70 factor (ECF subfamily)
MNMSEQIPSSPVVGGDSSVPAGESDQELIQKVQTGDASAFDLLVERYKVRLYGMIYNMLGNHDDAADLSQESFVKAFKSIGSFQSKSNFYTWLYRIGVNTVLNFIKRRKDNHLSLNEMGTGVEDDPSFKELTSRETVSGSVDREELQEKLNEALQKLSEEHRAVVVLHDIEGMKHQEIAKVLRCSEATARSRLFYAHQQLQALLANYI